MTYDQYWYGDTQMFRSYAEANRVQLEEKNRDAWLNGVYIYKALQSVMSAIGAKDQNSIEPYPAEPIDLYGREKTEEEIAEQEEKEQLLAELWMKRIVEIGEKWGKNKAEKTDPVEGEKENL